MIDVGILLVAQFLMHELLLWPQIRSLSGLSVPGFLLGTAFLYTAGVWGAPVLQSYSLLTRGQSFGMMILKMRILRPDGSRIPGKNIWGCFGLPLFGLQGWLLVLWLNVSSGGPVSPISLMLSYCLVLWFVILWGSGKYDERQGIIAVKT